ncbi:MAG: PEP-CTERM sorting domain-containing protein [Isosphaeraceae bacterium]|nr:PEP-CTERM sorting domain-containing protein [Isosphaeraceae bacterium]
MNRLASILIAFALLLSPSIARAAVIYASGQLLIENDPGTHDDVRENRIFRIDTTTGIATPASPIFAGSTPAGLAGTSSGELLGIRSSRLGKVDIASGTFSAIGAALPSNSTAFDIMSDGRGFVLPFNSDFETQQLYSLDLVTAAATPIGSATAIGDAIDSAAGAAPGTAEPFIISLGSVGANLYGIDLDSNSLISLDPTTGAASVIGALGSVAGSNGGGHSGFAALTGTDEDADGVFDTLYGAVNFGPAGERLGGLARFDLLNGTWSLVGTNAGLIYFGFGAHVVPEPSTFILAGIGCVALLGQAWRSRRARVAGRP